MKKIIFLITFVFMSFGCANSNQPVKVCPKPKVDEVNVDRARDLEAFMLLEKRMLTAFASERAKMPVKLVEDHQEVSETNDMALARYKLHFVDSEGGLSEPEFYFTVVLVWKGNIWAIADILVYPINMQGTLPPNMR